MSVRKQEAFALIYKIGDIWYQELAIEADLEQLMDEIREAVKDFQSE